MKTTQFAIDIAKSLHEYNAVAVGNIVLIPGAALLAIEEVADAAGIDEELVFVWPHNKSFLAIETPE